MQQFFPSLVQWQRVHGRHGLPWQGTRDPYRVWLSEVMLQQTQVTTVIGYYDRFLQAFPDVQALAAAHADAVLALWSGLGYYSRARNLHRCAQQVCERFGGNFPRTSEELVTLPGIGPSTAVAIAAFCFGERHSILDANVQRVLGRLLAFGGDLAGAREVRKLWQQADALIAPQASAEDMASYTQGLMDLGATVCTPRQPDCARCPAVALCLAHAQQTELAYPVRSKKLKRSAENWWLLVWHGPQGVWLQRRPESGIWAGLHCVPLFDSEQALTGHLSPAGGVEHAPAFKHVLTHKDLYLHPVCVHMQQAPELPGSWVADHAAVGLPAPLRKWLNQHLPAGAACS